MMSLLAALSCRAAGDTDATRAVWGRLGLGVVGTLLLVSRQMLALVGGVYVCDPLMRRREVDITTLTADNSGGS